LTATTDLGVLRPLPLFSGLTDAELDRVNRDLHASRFAAGAMVLTATHLGAAVYVVGGGTLKAHVVHPDGREVTLSLLGPGELIGELALLDHGGRSADVVVLEAADLFWFSRTSFQSLRRELPRFEDNLLAILVRRLRFANAQIEALATLDVFGRVAWQVLALAETYGQPAPGGGVFIPLRLTQTELAGLVGATRVRVNQALGEFKRRGVLTEDAAHRITLLDPAALDPYCR